MFADDTTIPLPGIYIESVDPTSIYTDGRSFAKRLWLDTSTGSIGTLKKRNAANTGWDSLINLDSPIAADSVTNTKLANMANATVKGRNTAGTGDPEDVTMAQLWALIKTQVLVEICLAASDETTALAAGTSKITFRMPHAMTVTAVRASLSTAQTSGSIFTVDINEGGSTILSTKLTIDNSEKTSTAAATPAVISDPVLADDAEITIDIDQIGDGTAKGLKVYLIGTRA